MKSKKMFPIIACIMAFTMTLSGCNNDKIPDFNEDGTLYGRSESELNKDFNYYVKNQDKYYILYNAPVSELESGYYFWTLPEYEKHIPVLDENSTLTFISHEKMPQETVFYKLEDKGFTVGSKFTVDQQESENKIFFSSNEEEYNATSPIKDFLWTNVNVKTSQIVEINNEKFTVQMIDPNGFIQGLTENAMYKFSYYGGTYYDSINIMADTHLFISSENVSTTKYIREKDIFFTVVIPDSLKSGYYYIPEVGIFYYNNGEKITVPDLTKAS